MNHGLAVCMRCRHRTVPIDGVSLCRISGEDVVNLTVCPIDLFPPDEPLPKSAIPGPGDIVKLVLGGLGVVMGENGSIICPNGKVITSCRCRQLQQWMNRVGYLRCLRNRGRLVGWFREKAEECGIETKDKSISRMMLTALRQWRDSHPKEAKNMGR